MTFWTDERVTELGRLAGQGYSASQAAFELGASRNAVISASHRNKVQFNHDGKDRPKAPASAPRAERQTPFRPPRVARRKPFRFEGPTLAPAPEPAPPRAAGSPGAHQCELLELNNESCRWPVSGDGPPFLFCGDPSADMASGRSYCAEHSRIAFDRRTDRRATMQPGARQWGAAG